MIKNTEMSRMFLLQHSFVSYYSIFDFILDLSFSLWYYNIASALSSVNRVPDSDSVGRGFESLRAGHDYRLKRQKARKPQILSGVFAIFMVHFWWLNRCIKIGEKVWEQDSNLQNWKNRWKTLLYHFTTNTLPDQKDLNRRGFLYNLICVILDRIFFIHNEEDSVFFYVLLHIHLLGDMNNEKGEVQYEQM